MTITLKSLCHFLIVLLGFSMIPNHLVAQENGHGISLDLAIGTLGDGASIAYRFSDFFALRGTSRAGKNHRNGYICQR